MGYSTSRLGFEAMIRMSANKRRLPDNFFAALKNRRSYERYALRKG